MHRKQSCVWHWLLGQSAQVQGQWAARRRAALPQGTPERPRVPSAEWPGGERWCASCQGFIPLFYCTDSRCKAHASAAAHESMVKRTYGLEDGEYEALLELQGGRCYVCRRPTTRRLAVDHDHVTGEPRGLLCADPTRGCNHAVLGSLSGPGRDELLQARRLVAYLTQTPYDTLKGVSTAAKRLERAELHAARSTVPQLEPPF